MMTQKPIDEWLALAYQDGDDCPPPELFLDAEWRALSDEERQAAATHAESCPACAAERDLARAFDQPVAASDETDAGVDELLAKINRATPSITEKQGTPETARLLRFPAMAKVLSRPALGLAAAAVAVFAVGVVLETRSTAPPALPDAPVTTVTRGSVVQPISPDGVVPELPESFSWEAVEGAARYRVTLTAVDDAVLWQGETTETKAAIPADVRSGLRPAVVYFWQVDAISESGSRVAWSAATEFRVEPAAAEETR